MTQPAPAQPGPEKPRACWSTRLLALLGFLLLGGAGAVFTSQQMAVEKARGYLKERFKTNIEVPVKSISARISCMSGLREAHAATGFLLDHEVDTGVASGEVMVNPWNHEVVDWNVSPTLKGTLPIPTALRDLSRAYHSYLRGCA